MQYPTVVKKTSQELDYPPELIDKIYRAYWLWIKEYIKQLPLKDNLSEEEFNKLKLNFNLPSLGKLYCTYDVYVGTGIIRERANDKQRRKRQNSSSNRD
jgi:hypothetical protein